MVDEYGLCGMKILQWASGHTGHANEHNLKNHIKRCAAYTGTHDNNTLMGWFESEAGEAVKKHLFKAVRSEVGDADIHCWYPRVLYK